MSEFIENNFYTFLIFGLFGLFVLVYMVLLFSKVKKQKNVAERFARENIGCAKVNINKISGTMASITSIVSVDGESEDIPVAYGYSENYLYLKPGAHNIVVSSMYEVKNVLSKKVTRYDVGARSLKVEVTTSQEYNLKYCKDKEKYIFTEKESK